MTSYVDLIFYAFFKLFIMYVYRHMYRHVEMCIQFLFFLIFFTFLGIRLRITHVVISFTQRGQQHLGEVPLNMFFFSYKKELACSCSAKKKPLYYLTLLATVPYHNLGSFGVSESLAFIRSTAAAFLPSSLSDHKTC